MMVLVHLLPEFFPHTCSQPAIQGPSFTAAQPEHGTAAGGAEPGGVDAG